MSWQFSRIAENAKTQALPGCLSRENSLFSVQESRAHDMDPRSLLLAVASIPRRLLRGTIAWAVRPGRRY